MPKPTRRNFLQMTGAASLIPLMPALPAAASTGAAGGTHAQMLWAGLYKNAGSAPEVAKIARSVGVSSQAAQGVYTKLVHSRILAAHSAKTISSAAWRSPPASANTQTVAHVKNTKPIKFDVVKFLTEDEEEILEGEELGVDETDTENDC